MNLQSLGIKCGTGGKYSWIPSIVNKKPTQASLKLRDENTLRHQMIRLEVFETVMEKKHE